MFECRDGIKQYVVVSYRIINNQENNKELRFPNKEACGHVMQSFKETILALMQGKYFKNKIMEKELNNNEVAILRGLMIVYLKMYYNGKFEMLMLYLSTRRGSDSIMQYSRRLSMPSTIKDPVKILKCCLVSRALSSEASVIDPKCFWANYSVNFVSKEHSDVTRLDLPDELKSVFKKFLVDEDSFATFVEQSMVRFEYIIHTTSKHCYYCQEGRHEDEQKFFVLNTHCKTLTHGCRDPVCSLTLDLCYENIDPEVYTRIEEIFLKKETADIKDEQFANGEWSSQVQFERHN